MEIGLLQVMLGFGYENISDAPVYAEELELALLADRLDYDHVWVVER